MSVARHNVSFPIIRASNRGFNCFREKSSLTFVQLQMTRTSKRQEDGECACCGVWTPILLLLYILFTIGVIVLLFRWTPAPRKELAFLKRQAEADALVAAWCNRSDFWEGAYERLRERYDQLGVEMHELEEERARLRKEDDVLFGQP